MNPRKLLILISVVAVAAGLAGMLPGAATAAPHAQDNLLQNPGFELPYTDNQQANGWDRYRITIEKPTDASALQYSGSANFSAETNPSGNHPELIHGGGASQHIGLQQDPWIAGVKQGVGNIPAGSQVSFCAYARLYANNDNYGKAPSVSSYEGRAQVGIFPDGDGATVDTPGIVWSPVANPHDNWQQICTSATVGASGKVTVFTHNDWRGYAAVHLDAWWDDASLTIQGQAAATPTPVPQQPQATSVPQQPVQVTPNAQGAIVHTVVAGDTLFGLSLQYGVSLDDIYALNGLNSQSVLSIGQQVIIKQGPGGQTPAQPTAAPTTAPEAGQPTPEATAAESQTPAAQATPEGPQPTATLEQVAANTNKLCVFAFNDGNGDGIRQTDEAAVPGADFNVIDAQGSSVATYTSANDTDPYCFTDLAAGSYTVDVQPAPGTTATSDKRWGVALTSGSTVNINFGSEGGGNKTAATASKDSTSDQSSGGSSIGGLLGGAIGLILLLVAGVLGAFIIARRRA